MKKWGKTVYSRVRVSVVSRDSGFPKVIVVGLGLVKVGGGGVGRGFLRFS